MAPDIVYHPPANLRTNLDIFRERINHDHGLSLTDYYDLHEFSVRRPNDFWMYLWKFLDIKASAQPTRAVDESLTIDQFPQFFEGSRLNYAENLLSRSDSGIAVRFICEENLWSPREISWIELREDVRKLVCALKAARIGRHDVVAIIGGSNPTSLAIILAIASVGALFAPFAPDAGEKVLTDRVGQLSPKVVFAESSYRYNGKSWNISERIDKVLSKTGTTPGATVICTSGKNVPAGWVPLQDFLRKGRSDAPLEFEQVPFHHPLLVAFSSGTTGTPKGIVHSHGGMVVNGKKESLLHKNFGPNDVHYHYAGIGWVLWNIMISALFCGTTVVLYDGSPFYPSAESLLQAVFAAGTTAFGAGPRYFSELQKLNVNPKPYTKNLKCILSAGAILTESQSKWLASAFGPVCQNSFSGGTELCGNFTEGHMGMPSHAGEMVVKALGMDIDVLDSSGKPVPPGQSGELICRKPFPNMPVAFWNDPQRKRYFNAYFSTFPRVWRHGDFIRMNPETKGWTILGRSDGVLNPSGIRFGSGEIYSILERHFADRILDSVCVGQQRPHHDQTERVFLFLRCRGGSSGGSESQSQTQAQSQSKSYAALERDIRAQIAQDLSRRHVPQFIFPVREIPYNANSKKLEIPLKKVLSEGEAGLASLTCPAEEKAVLAQYLPYHQVERLVAEDSSEAQKLKQKRGERLQARL